MADTHDTDSNKSLYDIFFFIFLFLRFPSRHNSSLKLSKTKNDKENI